LISKFTLNLLGFLNFAGFDAKYQCGIHPTFVT